MNIKNVVGRTEKEAVDKVRSLYGEEALILNVRKKQGKGLFGIFSAPNFVVTAAYNPDDTGAITDDSLDKLLGDLDKDFDKYDIEKFEASLPSNNKNKSSLAIEKINFIQDSSEDEKNKEAVMQVAANTLAKKALEQMAEPTTLTKIDNNRITDNKKSLEIKPVPTSGHNPSIRNMPDNNISFADVDAIKASKERISYLEKMLGDMQNRLMASHFEANSSRVFDNTVIQIFYEALTSQGVLDYAAKDILTNIQNSVTDDKTLDISYVAASVYTEILQTIKKPTPIVGGSSAIFVFFAGPTGVGKTTTIAKLAGRLVLEQNVSVGLMTADTYRIAAVDQLKTYADILGLDVRVIYEKKDFVANVTEFGETKDVVFVDTAGRSHKNVENLFDLKDLINVPVVSEKYLVLSMTTKYEDLVSIIHTYNDIGDFKLILTKFDETTHYGSIFNLCYTMGLEVVYITTGQNVPDDIELLKPEKIAKALLGLDTGL